MSDLPESAREPACPVCGGTGPDQFDAVGDYGGGPYEARCGDDWHDDAAAPVSPAVEEPGEALRYSPRHVPTLMIHDGEHSGEWVRASNYDAVYEGRRDAHEESRDLSRRLVEAVEEATRLRAETLRQGQRITALDALLVASEAEVERLKAKIGEADELLGPWGGTPAGTIGAVHNLIAENEQLRDALESTRRFLGGGPHQRIGEACGTDLCMACLARAAVDEALAGSPSQETK